MTWIDEEIDETALLIMAMAYDTHTSALENIVIPPPDAILGVLRLEPEKPTLLIDVAQVTTILQEEYTSTPIIPGPMVPIAKKAIKKGSPVPPMFRAFKRR